MSNIFGWFGSCFFAFCVLPQCIKCYKLKSTKDISWLFILLSLGGNIFSAIYIFLNNLITRYVDDSTIF